MLIELTSNKVRDLFILLVKLISAKASTEAEQEGKEGQEVFGALVIADKLEDKKEDG